MGSRVCILCYNFENFRRRGINCAALQEYLDNCLSSEHKNIVQNRHERANKLDFELTSISTAVNLMSISAAEGEKSSKELKLSLNAHFDQLSLLPFDCTVVMVDALVAHRLPISACSILHRRLILTQSPTRVLLMHMLLFSLLLT